SSSHTLSSVQCTLLRYFVSLVVISLLTHFFFLMIPPSPRSTLFPYTTLFRSLRVSSSTLRPRAAAIADAFTTLTFWSKTAFSTPDRKSTRLNSSHQIISYAVFCLKKKKYKKVMLLISYYKTELNVRH